MAVVVVVVVEDCGPESSRADSDAVLHATFLVEVVLAFLIHLPHSGYLNLENQFFD